MTAAARRNFGLLAMVGGALMVIGSLLPWFKIDATLTTITRTGMDDNVGWITIIFGVIAAGIAVQIIRGRGVRSGVRWNVGLIIVAALAGILAAVVWAGGTSASKSISDQTFGFVTAKYSTGLYVIALGIACVIAAAAALEILRQRVVDKAAAPTRCPWCSAAVPAGARFCGACGRDTAAAAPAT
ncbi:MAG: zinc ribbon domain-containing protein [Actinobacteria bacterium]|nr:zinc ribbon domain-containing protein [Actinomycetota bacterium]